MSAGLGILKIGDTKLVRFPTFCDKNIMRPKKNIPANSLNLSMTFQLPVCLFKELNKRASNAREQ